MHALILILAAGGVLRVASLGSVGLFGDEYPHIFGALKFTGILGCLRLAAQNPTHLLLDPLQAFVMGRISDRLWFMRLPSVFWGLAGVLGVWRLGAMTGRWTLGAAAAALLAFSPLHIEWSRRVDFYALMACLAVWQTGALLRLLEDAGSWKPYCAWSVIFLHSHPYAVVMGILHGLFLGLQAARGEGTASWKPFLRAWAVAGLCFLPWFLIAAHHLTNRHLFDYLFLREKLPLGEFLSQTPFYLTLTSDFHSPEARGFFNLPVAVAAGCAFFYLSSFLAGWRRKVPPVIRFCHWAVPLGWTLVVAVDLSYRAFFAPRQLMLILPFYLLAVAHGAALWLDLLGRRYAPAVQAAAASGALALFVVGALPAYAESTWTQERQMRDWTAMTGSLERFVAPGDVFYCDNSVVAAVLFYHYGRKGAFRALTGFSPTERGMEYEAPATLRLGRRGNLAIIAPRRAGVRPPELSRLWRITGEDSDFSLIPPIRDRAAVPPAAKK